MPTAAPAPSTTASARHRASTVQGSWRSFHRGMLGAASAGAVLVDWRVLVAVVAFAAYLVVDDRRAHEALRAAAGSPLVGRGAASLGRSLPDGAAAASPLLDVAAAAAALRRQGWPEPADRRPDQPGRIDRTN